MIRTCTNNCSDTVPQKCATKPNVTFDHGIHGIHIRECVFVPVNLRERWALDWTGLDLPWKFTVGEAIDRYPSIYHNIIIHNQTEEGQSQKVKKT